MFNRLQGNRASVTTWGASVNCWLHSRLVLTHHDWINAAGGMLMELWSELIPLLSLSVALSLTCNWVYLTFYEAWVCFWHILGSVGRLQRHTGIHCTFNLLYKTPSERSLFKTITVWETKGFSRKPQWFCLQGFLWEGAGLRWRCAVFPLRADKLKKAVKCGSVFVSVWSKGSGHNTRFSSDLS